MSKSSPLRARGRMLAQLLVLISILSQWGAPVLTKAGEDPIATFAVERPVEPFFPPRLVLSTVDGGTIDIHDLRGHAVLLGFFTTWWPKCRREAPAKEMLYREFRMDGLLVVGVALRESPDAVKGFAEELGITFPLLVDPKGGSMSLFGLRGHPSTVLIDRQGRVAGLVRGERAWYGEEGKALVRQLLEPTE